MPQFPKVTNPRLWLDPDTARMQDLYKYVGLDERKMAQSFVNYTKSLRYVGGVVSACLVAKFLVDGAANRHVFGENGNGGDLLTLQTAATPNDYAYNREFQRMRWLSEEPSGDDVYVKTRTEHLVDLGVKVTPQGNNNTAYKKSPHFKYF